MNSNYLSGSITSSSQGAAKFFAFDKNSLAIMLKKYADDFINKVPSILAYASDL